MKLLKFISLYRSYLLFLLFSFTLYFFLTSKALYGSFELDDFANLEHLESVKTFTDKLYFSIRNMEYGLGRPVSLFSFALQADSWPNHVQSFKLANVIIHLFNALLVLLISFKITSLFYSSKKTQRNITLLITCLWLYAPIHVFSVFYVIQRMTLLSTTFTLLNIIIFLYYRNSLGLKFKYQKLFSLSFFYALFLTLGILSKENAILTPLLILLIEEFLYKNNSIKHPIWRYWKIIALYIPVILLCLYLLLKGKLFYSATYLYPFSSLERVLNECVILWQYIYSIFIPTFGSFGLVHDDIYIYHSMFENITVLLSVVGIITLISLSFYFRKKNPLLAFGIIFFFTGHLLESTFLQLELKFDHRNYLPSYGLFLFFSVLINQSYELIKNRALYFISVIALVLYILFYLNTLTQTANAWKSSYSLANYHAKFHPDSKRALANYISFLYSSRQFNAADQLLSYLEKLYPDDMNLALNRLIFSSSHIEFKRRNEKYYLSMAKNGKYNRAIDGTVVVLLKCIEEKVCKSLDRELYRKIIDALLQNPNIKEKERLSELLVVQKAKSSASESRWNDAIRTMNKISKRKSNRIEFYFLLMQYQYMAKKYDDSLETLDKIEEKTKNQPLKKSKYENIISVYRDSIMEEIYQNDRKDK